jgi:hypothetical protein
MDVVEIARFADVYEAEIAAARLRAETTTCLPCLRALTHRQAAGR